MKHIPVHYSAAEAKSFFERASRHPIRRVLAAFRRRSTGLSAKLPFLELIWLPHYLFHVNVASRKGPGTLAFSVEGHSGAFAVFQMHANLVDDELDAVLVAPRITVEQAERTGREQLMATIMRRRGHLEKPLPQDTVSVEFYYYPYWLYYYERRRGYLDIRVFDAAQGGKAGNRTKTGILSALTFLQSKTDAAPEGAVRNS